MQRYQMFVGGQWVDAADGGTFESQNPYTGETWALVPRGRAEDANRAVEAADRAFREGAWPSMTASARGQLLRRLGDLVARDAERLARVEVTDNGKLISEMLGQLRYIPQWYYYFGGLADKLEGSVIPIDKPDTFNFTRHEPLGVCVAITAWNSPLLLATWKLAPGLAAGNTFVLKPSEFTSASALEFAKLVEEAGFPPGVVNIVTGFGPEVGEPLVTHDKVVKGVISGIFAATGQTCIAGSRLLVQEKIHNEFLDRLVALARTAKMGDPLDFGTQVGPITTPPQYRKVLDYIDVAKNEGANCVLGGGPAQRPECPGGWFVEPTIFTDVHNRMRIAQEEVFGPVLAAIPFKDEDAAIAIANDIPYGLAAGVWTRNIRRALKASERLKAGTVWVNTYRAVSYMSPFGGFKRSGLGRENGMEAIQEYLQTKSVWISTAT